MEDIKAKVNVWLERFTKEDGTLDIDNAGDCSYEFFDDLSRGELLDVILMIKDTK